MRSETCQNDIKHLFSQNLIYLMNTNNKSRKEVCKDLNLKYTTFCDWINARTIPGNGQIEKLSNYFDIKAGDFFVELDPIDGSVDRAKVYHERLKELDMKTIENMTDEQIKELIKAGFRFRHKTLDEYIKESGRPLIVSEEFDWGEPVGDEVW